MENLRKTISDILTESSTSCSSSAEDIDDIEINDSDEYETIEDLDDEIEYQEEMVNVIAQEHASLGTRYIVEFDMLSKYAECNCLEIDEALNNICEHNDIPVKNTYVLIESEEDFDDSMEEAKAAAKGGNLDVKKKAVKKIKDSKEGIKKLKSKVKLLKKKNKNKKCK